MSTEETKKKKNSFLSKVKEVKKEDLFFPKTNFPLKVDLNVVNDINNEWIEKEIYKKLLLKNKGKETFILHDGPIYSNGNIHMGHVFNHVIKDVIVRFFSFFKGFYTPYIMGWDMHGLPIENVALKEIKDKNISALEIRRLCKKLSDSFCNLQREELKKLGLFTDFNDFYITSAKEYEAEQIKIFSKMVEKGLVYKDTRPLFWSWSHETALAENEIEYLKKKTLSLYVEFELLTFFWGWNEKLNFDKFFLVVWTTQPWTIPENRFISLRSDALYVIVNYKNKNLIFCQKSLDLFSGLLNEELEVLRVIKGDFLLGHKYASPYGYQGLVVEGKGFVREEESGIVHLAPAFGLEDYKTAKKEGFDIKEKDCPLDANGVLNDKYFIKDLVGKKFFEANDWIVNDLNEKGAVLTTKEGEHEYPHDWRDKKPLVCRLTSQWFIDINSIKPLILNSLEKTNWFPEHSKEKMRAVIESRDDWCISRQRSWGVPLVSFIDEKNQEEFLDYEVTNYVASIVKQEGCDGWFLGSFLGKIREKFPRLKECVLGRNTMDVWFDSGVSIFCGLKKKTDIFDTFFDTFPADVYLEGSDQHRGWFNSSLIVSSMLYESAPYKKVVVHGFIIDKEGKKMSKSLGNVVSPDKMINKFGPDIIRLWASKSEFTKDVKVSEEKMRVVSSEYNKIRNCFRFLLGNLHYYNDDGNDLEKKNKHDLNDVDCYILQKAEELLEKSEYNYTNYRFSKVISDLLFFLSFYLNSFYFEINKTILYNGSDIFRRNQILFTFSVILRVLLRIIFPILPFLAEEVFKELKKEPFNNKKFFNNEESIALEEFKECYDFFERIKLNRQINLINDTFFRFREKVFLSIEKAREKKIIRNLREARVIIVFSNKRLFEKVKKININYLLQIKKITLIENPFFILVSLNQNSCIHHNFNDFKCYVLNKKNGNFFLFNYLFLFFFCFFFILSSLVVYFFF